MENNIYKYKLEQKKMFDIQRMPRDTGRQNYEIMIDGKKGVFKPVLGLRKKDFKQTQISNSNYGEFIAYKLAEKLRIPACKVELALKEVNLPYSKSGKKALIPGCISYLDLAQDETFLHAMSIINWYKTEHSDEYMKILNKSKSLNFEYEKYNDRNNNNIDLVIPAFEAYAKEKFNATNEECQKLRQSLIDMIMYDCKFANTDRNDENYGLAYSLKESKNRFYPIFDNEFILGCCEYEQDIQKLNDERLLNHINNDLTSRMGVPSEVTKVNYQTMVKYLFEKYPIEAKKSYYKIMQVSEKNLQELMDDCEGMSETHKKYALSIFRSRQKFFKNIEQEISNDKREEMSLDD